MIVGVDFRLWRQLAKCFSNNIYLSKRFSNITSHF